MICQGNIAKFCKFCYVEMFKSCSVTINPYALHVKCFLQSVSRTKTVQFKQTIEMNEHSLPETISVTFEFSGVCNLMQNTAH